jgi:serine phosphatase RsbU (regulator of sigma subunit)
MAILVDSKGNLAGRRFALGEAPTVLGRQKDSQICLDSLAVSRYHARITFVDGSYYVEDLDSSNGTFLNGHLVRRPVPLNDGDEVQVGPYSFTFRQHRNPNREDTDVVIREEVRAVPTDHTLHGGDPARKLEVVLAIGQHLAASLDLDTLLGRLLDQLMSLFPNADRGLVLLYERGELVLRAHRSRRPEDTSAYPYSRTVVKRALEGGVGILSEDVRSDLRFGAVSTLTALNLRSLLCVPLIARDGSRLGVVQLDCFQGGNGFQSEDLQLLTAVGMQVGVVFENAAMHEQIVREERLRHELALARQIQQRFLPVDFPCADATGFELFAQAHSAREVSGDLYDFFFLPDGRLVFLVGDVSGKGIPAALFALAVRTLARHPATVGEGPADTLKQLNAALAMDKFTGVFVTLVYGIYEPASGRLVLASCGHPTPLVRRTSGNVEALAVQNSRPLGLGLGELDVTDFPGRLEVGDMLIVYTDGLTEAQNPSNEIAFGLDRLQAALAGPPVQASVRDCAGRVQGALDDFVGSGELQDDQTLLLLRRIR